MKIAHHSIAYYLDYINPWNLVKFTQRIVGFVGLKFTLMLSSNYYITKGISLSLLQSVSTPWFRQKGLDAQMNSLVVTISMMPWSMKGFFGVISDNFAPFGYSKTSYLMFFTLLGTVAALLLVIIPDSILFIYPQVVAFLIFIIYCQGTCGDLFCQGKYVEKMKEVPESKADLITYVWFCQTFLGIWPPFFIGALYNVMNLKWLLIFTVPFVFQMFPFLYYGCMVDDKVAPELKNKFNIRKFKSQWKVMVIGLLMGISACTIALFAFLPFSVQAISSIVVSMLLIIITYAWMPKMIAKAVIYKFLANALTVSDGNTATYFVLAGPDCVENGPHFSEQFVFTTAVIVATVLQFSGLWFFQVFILKMHIRTMLWFTDCLFIGSSLISILLYTRTNVAIGIPDSVFYLASGAVLTPAFYMMNFMAGTLVIAKLCPKNIEVTVYAIFAGFSNFGQQVAAYIGIYFSTSLNIITTTEKFGYCDWSNFITFIVIINLLPILEIPLTFLLIPKGKVDHDFLSEEIKQMKYDESKEVNAN